MRSCLFYKLRAELFCFYKYYQTRWLSFEVFMLLAAHLHRREYRLLLFGVRRASCMAPDWSFVATWEKNRK